MVKKIVLYVLTVVLSLVFCVGFIENKNNKELRYGVAYDNPTSYRYVPLEKETVRKLVRSGISYGLAETITYTCFSQTDDGILCVRNIVGISNSESSLFKKCSHNNCFGIMAKQDDGTYKVKRYSSKEEGVEDFIKLYVKYQRYTRTTPQMRLDKNYCASECTYWKKNYNNAIAKIGL